jgi:histidyl-tRNA synthetase
MDGVKAELEEKGYATEVIAQFMNILNEAEENPLSAAEKYCSDATVFANLKKVLDFANRIAQGKFKAVYDKSLVRGMGYYTGMVFEIVSPKFGSSVAGGGKYDDMIGKFLGESVPAVGFSIGFERITSILVEEGYVPPMNEKVVLAYNDEDDFAIVALKAKELQGQGKIVTMLKRSKKFGKQLDALIAGGCSRMINMDGSEKVLG